MLFVVLFNPQLQATNYLAVSSGNWTTPSIWQGGISPGLTISNNANIEISSGVSVYTEDGITFNNNSTLTVNGSLEISNFLVANNQLTINVNDRLVINGYFEVNNSYSSIINGDILITEDFSVKNSAEIEVNGSLSIYGDFIGQNNNDITGNGKINVQGDISGLDTTAYTGTTNETYSKGTGIINHGCHIHIGSNDVIYVDGENAGSFSNYFSAGRDGTLDSDGKIIVEGDWNNYSSKLIFTSINTLGKTIFKGTHVQNIGGSKPTHFETLMPDNAAGLQTNNNLLINNVLDFITGSITTGLHDTLFILNNDVNAIINQGIGKSVSGYLLRYVSENTYDFPFASGSDYVPAQLEITQLGSMTNLTANFVTTDTISVPEGLKVNGTEISEFLDKGYWTFTPDNGTSVGYNITLTSRGHTNGGQFAGQHAILKRESGGEWQSLGTHDNATQIGSLLDPISVTLSDLTNFSDFIIGRSENYPLPVSLFEFYATCNGNSMAINWSTVSEVNNQLFILKYSLNGITFDYLATIYGNGTSNEFHHYKYNHVIKAPVIYYQLTQVDIDNQEHTFPIISAKCSIASDYNLTISNQNTNAITVTIENPYQQKAWIYLSDQLGRILLQKELYLAVGINTKELYLPELKTGAYILHFRSSNFETSKKIILY